MGEITSKAAYEKLDVKLTPCWEKMLRKQFFGYPKSWAIFMLLAVLGSIFGSSYTKHLKIIFAYHIAWRLKTGVTQKYGMKSSLLDRLWFSILRPRQTSSSVIFLLFFLPR